MPYAQEHFNHPLHILGLLDQWLPFPRILIMLQCNLSIICSFPSIPSPTKIPSPPLPHRSPEVHREANTDRIPRTTPPPLIIGSTPSPSTGGSTGLTSASRATDTPPHDSHPAVGHPHHASSSGASHPPLVAPINHRGSTGQSIHNNIIGRIPYNLPPRPPNITPSPQHHPGMPNSPRRTPDHRLLHMRPHRPASIGIFTPPLSPSPLRFSFVLFILFGSTIGMSTDRKLLLISPVRHP